MSYALPLKSLMLLTWSSLLQTRKRRWKEMQKIIFNERHQFHTSHYGLSFGPTSLSYSVAYNAYEYAYVMGILLHLKSRLFRQLHLILDGHCCTNIHQSHYRTRQRNMRAVVASPGFWGPCWKEWRRIWRHRDEVMCLLHGLNTISVSVFILAAFLLYWTDPSLLRQRWK